MSSKNVTHDNHYVPIWYQKGFIRSQTKSLFYLNSNPPKRVRSDGRVVTWGEVEPRAPKSCFQERDLYTATFGPFVSDEVEKYLFGKIDNDGAHAVRAFINNDILKIHNLFQAFFGYLDAQKLRTPKGLDWIRSKYPALTQLDLLLEMQHLRQMHCTMWLEGVREIVSAELSDVKFIVSDHPVTVYNAAFPPSSPSCQYPNDPSIGLNGTQTLFALDADHCLILTNLEYAKDPGKVDITAPRENARHFGQTIARTDALIRTRKLSRNEVISINYLLKARARRYIAAGEKAWLYPEKVSSVMWGEIGTVLLPPSDGLWHFGGEIYVGYEDGSTRYQDPFGRTTDSHKYLRKKRQPKSPGRNDPCGCGSGRKFKKCCEGVPEEDRPPWDVYSIRERNLMFCDAVMNILGLNSDKTWDDVRRELSDDQIKRIYGTYEALWPKDTNIADLLPRPDGRVFRGLFMGLIDPRTIPATVVGWLVYFDEIFIVSPFTNASYIKPEYSPVHSPAQYKEQTLKNVMLLIVLEPLIDSGVLHMIPDPMEFNADFRNTVWTMAKERTTGWTPSDEEMKEFRALAENDLERSTWRLPEASLRRLIRRSSPELSSEQIGLVIQHLKEKQAADPLALLQPMAPGENNGQLQMTRGLNLEVALFFAQLTGSAIYTNAQTYWRQLQGHVLPFHEPSVAAPWGKLYEKMRNIAFTLDFRPAVVLKMRNAGRLVEMREILRRVWNAIRTQDIPANIEKAAEQLSNDLYKAGERATKEWETSAKENGLSDRLVAHLETSIPTAGFSHNTVHRLLVLFGRTNSLNAVPMAMFLRLARSAEGKMGRSGDASE